MLNFDDKRNQFEKYNKKSKNSPETENRFGDRFLFFKSLIARSQSTGSVTPTSDQAADFMTSLIPLDTHLPFLELGAGTGPITKAILRSGIACNQLTSVEQNPIFCARLTLLFPKIRIVQGDAFNLNSTLSHINGQKFGAIISTLPLLNFPKAQREKYILDAFEWLGPDAPVIQLSYGLKAPIRSQHGIFTATPTKWIFANLPPARFWIYKDIRNRLEIFSHECMKN